jgi:putative phosphoribosyl transferase
VCVETPRWFFAMGQCYTDFRPTSDNEVTALLGQADRRVPTTAAARDPRGADAVAASLVGQAPSPRQRAGAVSRFGERVGFG